LHTQKTQTCPQEQTNCGKQIWERGKKEREEREKRKKTERDLRRETIAILVEEAEGLLELGDLVVGELVGHWSRERGVWEARK